MKRPRSSAVYILATLAVLLGVVGVEAVGRMLRAPAAGALAGSAALGSVSYYPDFRVGDLAPDFELPDREGKPHRLSELVRRDTMLFFACGCSHCMEVQTLLGILSKKLRDKTPAVISVTTMPRDRERTWERDTGVKQTFLYEGKDGPVFAQYRGHPCPRIYRLKPDRRVAWISISLNETPYLSDLGDQMAAVLGIKAVGQAAAPRAPGAQPSSPSEAGLPSR